MAVCQIRSAEHQKRWTKRFAFKCYCFYVWSLRTSAICYSVYTVSNLWYPNQTAAFLVMIAGALLAWGKSFINEQLTHAIGPMIERVYGQEMAADVMHISELVLRFTCKMKCSAFLLNPVLFTVIDPLKWNFETVTVTRCCLPVSRFWAVKSISWPHFPHG